jgi:hypothetical protein
MVSHTIELLSSVVYHFTEIMLAKARIMKSFKHCMSHLMQFHVFVDFQLPRTQYSFIITYDC